MAGGLFNKLLGGESKQELDSCCGAVNVTEEEEETPQAQTQAKAKADAEAGGTASR
ncbi:hypothetical protein [Nocardiopsis sp. CNT312]|uniref:hypothetical protein n=1 Tax=Nocardiopsis sp. CNT312 TaxID=1137268 RepID=UPI0004B07FF3|nr:hypothetical protein [Nocardiopsis sp. CNT312]